ncbi:MAG: hypothetical protein QW678_03025 [Candidatus Aenigmatarchaeota archaeon]
MISLKKLFKNKLFLVILFISISFLTLYFIFILNQSKYKIIYYNVNTNIAESLFEIKPIKIETFYINNSYTINFYKYYFSNKEDTEKYFNKIIEWIKAFNNTKIENIKIMNYNATIIYSNDFENIGVIVKNENKLLFINIKNFEKDIEIIKWFLKNYF